MERYVATQFYKADSPESRILRESGIAPSEFVLAADAQATIAALHDVIKQMGEQAAVIAKDAMAAKEQVAVLQARVRELEQPVYVCQGCGRLGRDEWLPTTFTCDELYGSVQCPDCGCIDREKNTARGLAAICTKTQSELTQRTAELEAAQHDAEVYRKMHAVASMERNILSNERADLQAELERVRGERDEDNKIGLPVIVELLRQADKGQDGPLSVLKGIIAERDSLRTLIAALPKVEGAVAVSNGYVKDSTRCHALFGADEDAALYAALLRHRQRMEG